MFNQEINQNQSENYCKKPGYKKQYFGMKIYIGPIPLEYPKDFKLKKRCKHSNTTSSSDLQSENESENESNNDIQLINDYENFNIENEETVNDDHIYSTIYNLPLDESEIHSFDQIDNDLNEFGFPMF